MTEWHPLKQKLSELADALEKAEAFMEESLAEGDTSSLLSICQKSQELAIHVGTMIENDSRGGASAVHLLEEYCEILWNIHETRSGDGGLFLQLSQKRKEINKSIDEDITPLTEKVFLLWKSSSYPIIEGFYEKALKDSLCRPVLLSIPYYEKNLDGSLGDIHDEIDLYPNIKKWDEYSIDKRLPDEIVITNPYDGYCLSSTVHPFFYAKNLRQYTKKLTYIPYFEVDEIDGSDEKAMYSMGCFAHLPGLIFADEVVAFSENMRKNHIESMTEFAGEQTRPVWEEKIKVICPQKKDKTKNQSKAVPKDWEKIFIKPDGTYRKAILYYTCVSTLIEHEERAVSKLKDVFEVFSEQKENVVLIWRPDPMIGIVKKQKPDLWEKYSETVSVFKKGGWAIYDDTDDIEEIVSVCDAYYGDPGNMVRFFREQKKPIMLQDISVLSHREHGTV